MKRKKIYNAIGIDNRKLEVFQNKNSKYAKIYDLVDGKYTLSSHAHFNNNEGLYEIFNYYNFYSLYRYSCEAFSYIVNNIQFHVFYNNRKKIWLVFSDKNNKYKITDKRRYNIVCFSMDDIDSDLLTELYTKYSEKSEIMKTKYIAAEIAYRTFYIE